MQSQRVPVPGAPVIGLSTYIEPARWGSWHTPAALLPTRYTEHVRLAGGVPVLLPPVGGIAAAVRRLDGLILTGGGDIDPASYGASQHPRTSGISRARDEAEFALLAAALDAGLPVLGICRGSQVLNVARGGTLRQHLPETAGHSAGPGTFGSHTVRVAPGSRLAAVLGTSTASSGDTGRPAGGAGLSLEVPTAHHQAIDRLGDGLTAVAWADDGVIEAVELRNGAGRHPFTLAVQWHPEAGDDLRLVLALAAAAARA